MDRSLLEANRARRRKRAGAEDRFEQLGSAGTRASPATPRTSPACTLKEMSRKLGRPLPGVPGSETSLELEQRSLADRVLDVVQAS